MALFLDIYPMSQAASNDALEYIFKSTHDRDDGIWSLHESPLIRRIIELFTRRGLDRFDAVKQQVLAWESGAKHKPTSAPQPKPGMLAQWSAAELGVVRLYLESLPPAAWGIDDHMLAVEYVIQSYLPDDAMVAESEWLATRSTMMGKVQANLEVEPSVKQADKVAAALPSTVAAAGQAFTLNAAQRAALEYGAARCAENVRAVTDRVRHRMKSVILDHVGAQMRGEVSAGLETRLVDEFASLNRDWRRISVTEAGECQMQGFVASLAPGSRVKRVEQYRNACGHCRKIDGAVMEVVSASAPDKDGEIQVWPGKTNVGRSASPMKRVGDALVPREPHELYWIAAGVQHPHCRGRWVTVPGPVPHDGDDPEFGGWLAKLLN